MSSSQKLPNSKASGFQVMRWQTPLALVAAFTIVTGVFVGSHIGTRFDAAAAERRHGLRTSRDGHSDPELRNTLSGTEGNNPAQHSRTIRPGSLKSGRKPPSAAEAKLKLQSQLLDVTSRISNRANSTEDLQTSTVPVPISAGWTGMFKSKLSAAADGFQKHSPSDTSTVTKQASHPQIAASQLTAASHVRLTDAPANQTFPWNKHFVRKRVCDDSCDRAKNGICDDGSKSNPTDNTRVWCDLGTDCSDCGAWIFHVPGGDAAQPLAQPIKLLRNREIEVFVKNTSTVPSFNFAYTDATKDVDVSGQMAFGGVVELGLTQMWYTALRDQCIQQNGSRALVVDVGGNFGWYSAYAAKIGCRVVTWEPVPHFRAFLEYNSQLNHLEGLIAIRDNAVAEVSGKVYNMVVPGRGIWGTAGIDGLNVDRSNIPEEFLEKVTAVGARVDDVVQEDVLLLKVDVEGFEPAVIASAEGLLQNHKVTHIVMEYTPGAYELQGQWTELRQVPQMLTALLRRNYTVLHVADHLSRAPLLTQGSWKGQIPPLEQVTPENVQFDVADTQLLEIRGLGCPRPKELQHINPVAWSSCNSIPEDLHPKSFRSTFGHNTNIWLTTNSTAFQVGKPVGIMSMKQDMSEFYSQSPLRLGMGSRPCDAVDPKMQVRHRCTCTNETLCGAEAALVEQLSQQGKMVITAL